jgi:hypothetical protein
MAFVVLDDVTVDGKISVIGRDFGRPRSRRLVVSPTRRAAAWSVRSLRFEPKFEPKEEIPMYHVPN